MRRAIIKIKMASQISESALDRPRNLLGKSPEELRAFLDAVRASELRSLIKKQTEIDLPEPPKARGFEIRA